VDNTQLTTFGTHIRANSDTAVVAALAAGNLGDIRDWYSGESDAWVFVGQMGVDSAVESLDWAGEYASFKDDIPGLRLLFDNGTYNVDPPGAREALNSVFASCPNSKSGILAAATRHATELEKIFMATTTGPGGGDGSAQAQSAIVVVSGGPSTQDVDRALELTA